MITYKKDHKRAYEDLKAQGFDRQAGIAYERAMEERIRERYSANEEFAILRKKLAGIGDDGEFEEYSAFVERCKAEFKGSDV